MQTRLRTIAAVLGTLLVAAGCSNNSPTNGSLTGTTSSPAHSASAAFPPLGSSSAATGQSFTTVTEWNNNGGGELDLGLIDLYNMFNNTSSQDLTSRGQACQEIQGGVQRAQAFGPVPQQQAQTQWSKALAEVASAATECVAAGSANSTSAMDKATSDLVTAYQDLASAALNISSLSQ